MSICNAQAAVISSISDLFLQDFRDVSEEHHEIIICLVAVDVLL